MVFIQNKYVEKETSDLVYVRHKIDFAKQPKVQEKHLSGVQTEIFPPDLEMRTRVSFVIKMSVAFVSSYYKLFIFSSSSQELLGQFQLTWNKASLGFKFVQKGLHPFPRGDNNEKVKIN